MLVTLSGIVTLVRLMQRQKAPSPMLVTLAGMFEYPQATAVPNAGAIKPNAGDAGDRHARQTTAVPRRHNPQCW